MTEKPPEAGPPDRPVTPDRGTALPPRWVVTIVTLAVCGALVYSASQRDYKSMIVSALVVLFILGADIGAILRGWRGGGQ